MLDVLTTGELWTAEGEGWGSGAVTQRYVVIAEDELDRGRSRPGRSGGRGAGRALVTGLVGPSSGADVAAQVDGFPRSSAMVHARRDQRLAEQHSIRCARPRHESRTGDGAQGRRDHGRSSRRWALSSLRTRSSSCTIRMVTSKWRRIRQGAARKGGSPAFEILVAAPHPESEAWVIAGAAPLSSEGNARRVAERRRLGFYSGDQLL